MIVAVVGLLGGIAGGVALGNKPHSHRVASAQNARVARVNTDLQVDITKQGLQPDTVILKVGQTLQINANDGQKHSFSHGEGGSEHSHSGAFSSGDFNDGEAWKVTFKKAGTYQFHDHYNPNINLLVVAY